MSFEICDLTILTIKPKIDIFMAVDGSRAPGRITEKTINDYFLKTVSECTDIQELMLFQPKRSMGEKFNPHDEGVLKENSDKFIAFSEENEIEVNLYDLTLRKIKKYEMATFTKFIQANGTYGTIGYQQVDFTFQKLFNEAPKFSKTLKGAKVVVRQKD